MLGPEPWTALEVVARRNLDIAAVVVSESNGGAASLEDTVATIQVFAETIDVVGIPRLPPGGMRACGLRAPRRAEFYACLGRSAARRSGVVRCRTGTVTGCGGPGSAITARAIRV